jgi:hypothetical protein
MTSYGVEGSTQGRNAMIVDGVLCNYASFDTPGQTQDEQQLSLPADFICECYAEYGRWQEDRWCRIDTRGGFKSIPCNYGDKNSRLTINAIETPRMSVPVTVHHHWTHWTFLETLIIVGQVFMHLSPFIILDQS